MRYDVLRSILKGEKFEPTGPSDTAWLDWAMNHKPLLSPSSYTAIGRRLNHFCVGSDPEFCFARNGARADAAGVGLQVGLAAGCDQNERLVELRPWPSVSVIEHVAGILTALRWMYRVYSRDIVGFEWRAGAFFAGDGMGGHVHFGRKRPTRDEEVLALDGLARAFKFTGLFPVQEWDRRIKGDKLGQIYGRPGDYRVQKHGYEYRSLPSWLQSPVVAFIVLTASKLAVLDPSITTTWNERKMDTKTAHNLLRGLAKLYRYRDDDAYLLYHLLTREGDAVFYVDHAKDFAPAWGIDNTALTDKNEYTYILPACIQPHEFEVKEIEEHLLHGVALKPMYGYPPSFKYQLPNKNYVWVPTQVHPGRHSGFGDLIHNLVQSQAAPIYWQYSNNNEFQIAGYAATMISPQEERFLQDYHHCQIRRVIVGGIANITMLTVPKDLCQTATIGRFRDTLLRSGLLPLWTVDTVEPLSFEHWLKERPQGIKNKTWSNI